MKYLAVIVLLAIAFLPCKAQSIDNTLSIYSNNFPQEKIHVQTDKETYFPGETIWFKVYLMADDLPSITSTNLYADLLTTEGKLVEHKTMPVLKSSGDSYFTIPSAPENRYIIRAYTTWMLNFDTAFIYDKAVTIIGSTAMPGNDLDKPVASLVFFAEGGNMVAGKYNYIAFKAMQSNGLPYEIKAAIKDSKNQLIDSIESVHDGMGLLKFTPKAGETYVAEWVDNKGVINKTPLPQAQPQGVMLHTEQLQGDLYYLISSPTNIENLQTLNVVATMNQKPVYEATIQTNHQTALHQKFSTKTLSSGILQLTVFDKNNHPLAERIVFINNKNYSFNTRLVVSEKSLDKRGKNKIEIEVPDTISSNLSLAIYDASLEQQMTGRNIYTDLLLQGDLKGNVYNADWYFSDTATDAPKYLDLVMQTNGWRRYNWDRIVSNQMPPIIYPRDNYLNIYGKAVDDKQEPLVNKIASLLLQTKDSSKQWYMPVTRKDGTFKQNGLIFYDTATVFYKTTGVGITKDYNGLSYSNTVNKKPFYFTSDTKGTGSNTDYSNIFLTEIKNNNIEFEKHAKLLKEVAVKISRRDDWKNNAQAKIDENYATGMFRGRGATSRSFDLLHDETAADKLSIENYLSLVTGGVLVGNCFVFVNEVLQDNNYLQSIPIEQIAYIKYFEHSYGMVAAEQQIWPSIAIYLKKGKDLENSVKYQIGSLSKIKLAGYSPLKEFYSPDYSLPDERHAEPDLRTTLLWQPYILTDKENKKATVTFFNNDKTTKMKIVLEGMNEEGKLIHIEKIIE